VLAELYSSPPELKKHRDCLFFLRLETGRDLFQLSIMANAALRILGIKLQQAKGKKRFHT
jgi:hypothetical protein